MSNYDDLLREKEKYDLFDDSYMEKHWEAMEKKIDTHTQKPPMKYRKLFLAAIAVAAVSLVVLFTYTLFKEKLQQTNETVATTGIRSAIIPPLNGANVPYETFSFNATTGDTLFTLNGSIIIFPKNAVLNSKGEIVNGNIEVRTREFNDVFDYSIAGIPMDYDSAGANYKFISSAMIDISAYQNGEQLQVNPDTKPQLNLVSTNKERKTNLYKLDTVTGKWMNKGRDEVNLVQVKNTNGLTQEPIYADVNMDNFEMEPPSMPAPPQKASNLNPVINVIIDPASFKELLVYDGLKFEVTDAKENTVGEDSKTDWDNIELTRGEANGTYKVIFSARNKKVTYNVKPVLEGKDFEAAEKLYQQKIKEYTRIQNERKKSEDENQKLLAQQNNNKKRSIDSVAKELEENNKRVTELNKLIELRNKFTEAENTKILAINKQNKRLRDSLITVNKELVKRQMADFEKQIAIWNQANRIAALEQNLIRSFEINGFGYWNCDRATLPATEQYVGNFKTIKNEIVMYNTLCMATEGINRLENYYNTNRIGLINKGNYFGWAFNANQFYYFTKTDFKNATRTNNPNTITISMNLYEGDVKNYNELKGYIFNLNNSNDISKK